MPAKKPYEDAIRVIDEQVIPNIDHLIDTRLQELRIEYERQTVIEMLLEEMGLRKKGWKDEA